MDVQADDWAFIDGPPHLHPPLFGQTSRPGVSLSLTDSTRDISRVFDLGGSRSWRIRMSILTIDSGKRVVASRASVLRVLQILEGWYVARPDP